VSHGPASFDEAAWAVAILASRESPAELHATMASVLAALQAPATVDVLVNGNRELAQALAQRVSHAPLAAGVSARVRVWFLRLGDKAGTWNRYVHAIWPGATSTFFVDGYVRVAPDALARQHATLAGDAGLFATTGMPASGRNARQLRAQARDEGYLHGNLFAVPRPVMEALRQRDIRLPLGLYGYDGLIGAMLAFGLDPSRHEWDMKRRIRVLEDVRWTHDERQWWNLGEVRAHWQRIRKQALRRLVVEAVKDFLAVQRRLPEHMPATLAELVLDWAGRHPATVRALNRRSPLTRGALTTLHQPRDWSLADQPPELMATAPSRG